MENIFENAKFGDKFLTKDNRIALYMGIHTDSSNRTYVGMEIEGIGTKHYKLNGEYYDCSCSLDIISKYEEPVDEEKLNTLAIESWNNLRGFASAPHVLEQWNTYVHGFKEGYRKAKYIQ